MGRWGHSRQPALQQTRQLKELDTRYQRQEKNYEEMPGSEGRGKFLSNKTHYSPTDPAARIAVKQKQKKYSIAFTKRNWKEPKQDNKR
jgi:hypothetical protein